ncbi:hypothetical protein [Christiangramia echinicola]|uniref:hypothetical protein n=1 Tax=Christiangramia echinicola TaxID=279359 RepID=UPI0004187806|nr:hypothetical protein [Christiangramia echinicola]
MPISSLTKKDLNEIELLLKEYYEEPNHLLNEELRKNSRIDFYRKPGSGIEAFFMTGWGEISIASEKRLLIYLGLSCVNNKFKEKKLASKLYYFFTREALKKQSNIAKPIILFGTTATPVILLTLPKIWDNVEPNLDGSYSKFGGEIIRQIRKEYNLYSAGTEHPFVLKNIAVKIRYSRIERERFKEVCERFNLKTFESLDIDETKGDRMLILCNLPSKENFQNLKNKLFLQNQYA